MKEVILGILPKVLEMATPALKEAVHSGVKALVTKARESENPYDDAAVALLASILGVPLKG